MSQEQAKPNLAYFSKYQSKLVHKSVKRQQPLSKSQFKAKISL
jgi:hypothetical protein